MLRASQKYLEKGLFTLVISFGCLNVIFKFFIWLLQGLFYTSMEMQSTKLRIFNTQSKFKAENINLNKTLTCHVFILKRPFKLGAQEAIVRVFLIQL